VKRSLELKVGLLIGGALVVLVAFLVILGNFSVGKGYRIEVDFHYAGNIHPGAPVKVSGIKVGKIDEVLFLGGRLDERVNRRVQVRLQVWLEERVKETIRQDAQFFINTAGVLGEQYLEIVPGSWEKPPLGESLPVAGIDPPRTDLIVARLYDFLDSTTKLLQEDKDLIRNLLRNSAGAVAELNQLLAENRKQIGELIVASTKLFDEGARTLADVRAGMGDPRVLGRAVANLDATLASANTALKELTPRAARFLDEGTRVAGLLDKDRIDRGLSAFEGAVTLIGKTGGLVDNVNGLVTDLRAGKGTAGSLLVKDELYADIKEMVRDLKRNPWKFLWKE
jgi:phospholipid/cholesterol/gamma-HCH transport system substrate-binding protein